MEEEPHAHENLVAKARRQDQNSRTGSVASLTESTNTQSVPETVAERGGAAASTFLLEPMILVLLFAYNFSCKLWNGKARKPGLAFIYIYTSFSNCAKIPDHLPKLHGGLWLFGCSVQATGHQKCHQ